MKSRLKIKPVNIHNHLLVLFDKNKKGGVDDWCSSTLNSQGMVMKAEYNKSNYETANVRVFKHDESSPKAFLRTTQPNNIYSIQVVEQNSTEFILVSGDGSFLDIFTYDSTSSSQVIGKQYSSIC